MCTTGIPISRLLNSARPSKEFTEKSFVKAERVTLMDAASWCLLAHDPDEHLMHVAFECYHYEEHTESAIFASRGVPIDYHTGIEHYLYVEGNSYDLGDYPYIKGVKNVPGLKVADIAKSEGYWFDFESAAQFGELFLPIYILAKIPSYDHRDLIRN